MANLGKPLITTTDTEDIFFGIEGREVVVEKIFITYPTGGPFSCKLSIIESNRNETETAVIIYDEDLRDRETGVMGEEILLPSNYFKIRIEGEIGLNLYIQSRVND